MAGQGRKRDGLKQGNVGKPSQLQRSNRRLGLCCLMLSHNISQTHKVFVRSILPINIWWKSGSSGGCGRRGVGEIGINAGVIEYGVVVWRMVGISLEDVIKATNFISSVDFFFFIVVVVFFCSFLITLPVLGNAKEAEVRDLSSGTIIERKLITLRFDT